MRFLFVVAHPDDEVLGAGGFIKSRVDAGDEVHVVILNAEYEKTRKGMMDDLLKSHEVLGVDKRTLCSYTNMNFFREDQRSMVERIELVIAVFEPDFVFTHFPEDIHSDHKITSIVTQQAARLWQRHSNGYKVKGLYFMEVLSSTNWGDCDFAPDTYVSISEECLEAKIEALEVYDNVVRPMPHPRSEEAIKALAVVRGCEIGYPYAEAFKTCWRDCI